MSFFSRFITSKVRKFIAAELCCVVLFTPFNAIKLIYSYTCSAMCSIDCEVINLAHNKLNELPSLQEQTDLEELDVSKNEIHVVSGNDFKHLKNLRTLRLSENFISKIDLWTG